MSFSLKDDGGPAFPFEAPQELFGGMSLRDYFAAKALQAYVEGSIARGLQWSPTGIAKEAYLLADAMLEQRKK